MMTESEKIAARMFDEIVKDSTDEVESLIVRDSAGQWLMCVYSPSTDKLMTVRVYFNPWTGEELT